MYGILVYGIISEVLLLMIILVVEFRQQPALKIWFTTGARLGRC